MVTERKLKILLMWMSVLAMLLIPELTRAQTPLCRYMYISNFEHTRIEREVIWFWTRDSLYGPVHSNDFIGLRYMPIFYDQVTTPQNRFLEFQANPYFEIEPQFGAPFLVFPELIEFNGEEGISIGEPVEGMQYRLVMENDIGFVYEWHGGVPFDEELEPIEEYFWEDLDWLYFDSPLEMYGTIDGVATIGCSQDIRLLDNVLYEAANPEIGIFDMDECDDMLGIVSARDIIIANTFANGRDNGWGEDRDNLDRHSIVINAALAAFGESFTFEDQNDEWELRQGPEPDDRGVIYLVGSLANRRRGFVCRSNHQGTGYGKYYRHDTRFIDNAPPLFPNVARRDVLGEGNFLVMTGEDSPYYVIGEGGYRRIIATAGTEIILSDSLALSANDEFRLLGEKNNPVVIRRRDPDRFPSYPGFSFEGCDTVIIRHVRFEDGICWPEDVPFRHGVFESCDFPSGFDLQGASIEFRNCTFGVNDSCDSPGWLNIRRNLNLQFRNCTIQDSITVYQSNGHRHNSISFIDCEIDGSINIRGRSNSIEIINCEINDQVELRDNQNCIRIVHTNFGGSLEINSIASELVMEDCQILGNDLSILSDDIQLIHCEVWGNGTLRQGSIRIEDSHFSGSNLTVDSFNDLEVFDSEIHAESQFNNGRSAVLSESEFLELVAFRNVSDIEVLTNEFYSGMSVDTTLGCNIERNLIRGGLSYRGHERVNSELTINNNTIFGADSVGILIHETNRYSISNNIIFNNQVGLQIVTRCDEFWSGYNCFFLNPGGDFVGIGPGWFDFNADPMLVDHEAGDYHLSPGSPCIDRGNPSFDRDPDGTQVDIGAFRFDHSMSVEGEPIVVNDFSVTASPNPFNNRTTISFTSRTAGIAEIDIYDLNGRIISSLLREVSRGANNLPLSGHEIGGTGMYFVKIRCNYENRIVKIIYLP